MKMRYTALAFAAACAAGGHAWADEAAAKKWIDNEFQPSTLSKEKQAVEMKANIEKFFGATVEGYKTYRYYDGNDTLRAWITTPLVMDIFDRKEGTIAALFSPRSTAFPMPPGRSSISFAPTRPPTAPTKS